MARADDTDSTAPRPFLKWAGGKRQLLPELLRRVPPFKRYFEPFVGGGALFFRLAPPCATLSDVNGELINAYQVIRDDVEGVIKELSSIEHNEDFFYECRDADRTPAFATWSPVKRAARLIYLNKTCFNGLYRVNSKGFFNVPFGDIRTPNYLDVENLRRCSATLQGQTIAVAPFGAVLDQAERGDFIYFDPPYAPLTATANFTAYAKDGFRGEDQEALRDLCRKLDEKGVSWMLSNSSAPLILDLYKEYEIEFVEAARHINSKVGGRGKVKEVIITSVSATELTSAL